MKIEVDKIHATEHNIARVGNEITSIFGGVVETLPVMREFYANISIRGGFLSETMSIAGVINNNPTGKKLVKVTLEFED